MPISPKFEFRNSKQIQMTKKEKIRANWIGVAFWLFGFDYFDLFRISSFEFRILTDCSLLLVMYFVEVLLFKT